MSWRNGPITEKQEIMITKIEEDAMIHVARRTLEDHGAFEEGR